jgi:alpha-mannosidase
MRSEGREGFSEVQESSGWKVFVLASTHNDIGWAGTPSEIAEHRERGIIDKLIDIMERRPRFAFAMEVAFYLEEYLGRKPHRAAKIKELVDEGFLEWGGTYTQPFESLLPGETLLRQIYHGRGWLQKRWGIRSRGAWNVDVQGRTIQIPQVLKKSGIDYMVLSRNQPGLYWWEAPDGSRVLVLSLMEGHYGYQKVLNNRFRHFSPLGEDTFAFGQDRGLVLNEVASSLTQLLKEWEPFYEEYGLPRYFLLTLTADYTVPDEALIDFIDSWNAQVERGEIHLEVPIELAFSTVDSYLARLEEEADLSRLPVIKGERPNPWIYTHGPTHEKTVTAMRSAASELVLAEQLSAIRCVNAGNWSSYPVFELDEAWRDHLYLDHGHGGFHGQGTDEVFRFTQDRALQAAKGISHAAFRDLAAKAGIGRNGILVYNPLPWPRTDWASCEVSFSREPGVSAFNLVDETGNPVPYQVAREVWDSEGNLKRVEFGFVAKEVPPVGYRVYEIRPSVTGNRFNATEGELLPDDFLWENQYLRARVTRGGLIELIDKVRAKSVLDCWRYRGAEVIELGSPGVDVGEHAGLGLDLDEFDWTLDAATQPIDEGVERTLERGGPVRVLEEGALKVAVATESEFTHCGIRQTFTFYRDLDSIDVDVDVYGWDGTHSRELRVMFPVKTENPEIAYEVPFHRVRVGKDEINPFQHTRPREVQNWMQAFDADSNVTLSSSCIAHDWVDPLDLTERPVLQAILLATKRSNHPKGNWYTQEGDHHYSFKLSANARSSVARTRFGWSANNPLRAVQGSIDVGNSETLGSKTLFGVNTDHVMITAVKKCEDDDSLVVRLWEFGGKDERVRLTVPGRICKAELCSILEEPISEVSRNSGGFEIEVDGFSITTLKLHVEVEER